MRVIDIDQINNIENHIHYIKEYEGRLVLMDKMARIIRNPIKFSIEYKPMGAPDIKINLPENSLITETDPILSKVIEKIHKLDTDGTLSALLKS